MRIRAILFSTAVAASAVAGISVSSASAAPTLFTSNTHATRVAVGTTGSAINNGPIVLTSGGAAVNSCSSSTLHFDVVTNNDAAGVGLTVTGGTFTCSPSAVTGTFSPDWLVTVTGNPTVDGTNRVWPAAVDRVTFDLAGVGEFSGNLTTGVTASQPTTGTAPVCLNLANAGTVTGSGISGTIDGVYCLEGPAASWSLT